MCDTISQKFRSFAYSSNYLPNLDGNCQLIIHILFFFDQEFESCNKNIHIHLAFNHTTSTPTLDFLCNEI